MERNKPPYGSIEDLASNTIDREKTFFLMAPLLDYTFFNYDANALRYNFEVPAYIIQGESDWETPTESVQEYFEKINAPEKELVIVQNSWHNLFFDYPEEFGNIVKGFLE